MKNKSEKEYRIFVSKKEEDFENWFWSNDKSIEGFAKVLNPTNKKSIVIYKRDIDENYINDYNKRDSTYNIKKDELSIVLNEFYRKKLKIEKNQKLKLVIKNASCFDKIFYSNWSHPNPTVSLSYKINITSIFLGLISLILGIISLILTCK
jgi:hypothetical protein